LTRDIIKTKRLYYDKQILNSNDRIKSTWNIVKALTGKKSHYDVLPTRNIFDGVSTNSNNIPESFNKYFLSVVGAIINNKSNNCNPIDKRSISSKDSSEFLFDIFKVTFPTIKYSSATTNEITNIINN
jgi:hypothetical protein